MVQTRDASAWYSPDTSIACFWLAILLLHSLSPARYVLLRDFVVFRKPGVKIKAFHRCLEVGTIKIYWILPGATWLEEVRHEHRSVAFQGALVKAMKTYTVEVIDS